MGKLALDYSDLDVYKISIEQAMEIFHLTKRFPVEEKYSLIDQIRRSSRSVSANIAEAWRKRRYKRGFTFSLTVAQCEASETRVWLEYAYRCGYLDQNCFEDLNDQYDKISRMLYKMIISVNRWTL